VVIHNHPYYVSLIAALGMLPELVHQTGSLFLDDMYCSTSTTARSTHPGVQSNSPPRSGRPTWRSWPITAPSSRAATWPRRLRRVDRAGVPLAYDVMLTGRTPSPMNRGDMCGMRASLIERAADVYWPARRA